jgi:hypothetical protein
LKSKVKAKKLKYQKIFLKDVKRYITGRVVRGKYSRGMPVLVFLPHVADKQTNAPFVGVLGTQQKPRLPASALNISGWRTARSVLPVTKAAQYFICFLYLF